MKWTNGLIKANPLLRLALGVCPAVAVAATAVGGLSMGLVTCCVLVLTNIVMALIKGILSDRAWLPVTLLVATALASCAQLLLKAQFPGIEEALGVFVPLTGVSCLILNRSETSAKAGLGAALADGLCMGAGYTLALTLLGCLRELLGRGTLFGWALPLAGYEPVLVAAMPAGGFLLLGLLMGLGAPRGGKEERDHE